MFRTSSHSVAVSHILDSDDHQDIEHEFEFDITMRRTAKRWPASADDPGAASEWEFSSINVGNRGISWIEMELFLGSALLERLVDEATLWAQSNDQGEDE